MEEKTKEKGNKKAEINKDKQLTQYFKKKSEIQYRGKRIPWPYTKKKIQKFSIEANEYHTRGKD